MLREAPEDETGVLASEGLFPLVCAGNREDKVSENYRKFPGEEAENGGNLYQRFYFLCKGRGTSLIHRELEVTRRPGNLRN